MNIKSEIVSAKRNYVGMMGMMDIIERQADNRIHKKIHTCMYFLLTFLENSSNI